MALAAKARTRDDGSLSSPASSGWASPADSPAHFAAWVRLWQQHTSQLLAPEAARELQLAAHGIARNLFRGYFGADPAFAPTRHAHEAPDSN